MSAAHASHWYCLRTTTPSLPRQLGQARQSLTLLLLCRNHLPRETLEKDRLPRTTVQRRVLDRDDFRGWIKPAYILAVRSCDTVSTSARAQHDRGIDDVGHSSCSAQLARLACELIVERFDF